MRKAGGFALGAAALAGIVAVVVGLVPGTESNADPRSVVVGAAPFPAGASLADVAEGAVPGVVNISTTRVVKMGRGPGRMPFNDPFFEYFFGPRGEGAMPRERRSRSLGSGVIVGADGVILTNNHVVEGAEDIRVKLWDGREVEASIVGADPRSDLAVIKLKEKVKDLHPIPIGDSDKLRLAETVVAIGNPFGLGNTVTSGIVSAKGRANMGIVDYEDFIQTDAAINPGNSGGALLNDRGQLVGINTAILSETGGYQGVGFAIPSNMALGILNSILTNGRVIRGWLGVVIQDITPELAESLDLKNQEGVLVSDVPDDTPAAKSGIRRGDVIVKVAGEKVDSSARLRNLVAARGAGATLELTVVTDGRSRTVSVLLGEQPAQYTVGGTSPEAEGALEGLSVAEITPDLKQEYRIPSGLKDGVVVTDVEPGSAAWDGGLRQGDVVLEVNRRAVSDVEDFRDAYKRSQKRVLLLVLREGRTVFITLQR